MEHIRLVPHWVSSDCKAATAVTQRALLMVLRSASDAVCRTIRGVFVTWQ
jgi:hypothetical protein